MLNDLQSISKATALPPLAGLQLPQVIPFCKIHGAGNDYVYVEEFKKPLPHPELLAQHISHRNFGVGSDGLVLIGPSDVADFRMRIFNADGSEAEMCGNASRCVGKYLYEHGFTISPEITLETKAGIKTLFLNIECGLVQSVRVDMGTPELTPAKIPMEAIGESFINQKLTVLDNTWYGTAVSMGNPHLVVFVDDVTTLDLNHIGPVFEHYPLFPERVNTEFVQIISSEHILMRVWERGSGETLACGTGASASLVACVLNNKTKPKLTVTLPGGDLLLQWAQNKHVFMTGPAEIICTGEYHLPQNY